MQTITAAKVMPPSQLAQTATAPVTAKPMQISGSSPVAPAKSAKNAADQDSADDTSAHQRAKMDQTVRVRDVNVTRGPQGMEVQISSSGPMQPEAMRLENPDRVVIDLPNAMWNGSPRQIGVKAADVKSVRMALYQLNPPVTRVVVDLTEARDYELLPSSNGLRVRLHALTANSAPAMPAAAQVAAATAVSVQPANPPAMSPAATSPATTTTAPPVATTRSAQMPTSPVETVSTSSAAPAKTAVEASVGKSSPAVTVSMAKPAEKPAAVVVKQDTTKPSSTAAATPRAEQPVAKPITASAPIVATPVKAEPSAPKKAEPSAAPKQETLMAKAEQPAVKPATTPATRVTVTPNFWPVSDNKPVAKPETQTANVQKTETAPSTAASSPAAPVVVVTPSAKPPVASAVIKESPSATTRQSSTDARVSSMPTKPASTVQSATAHTSADAKPAAQKPVKPVAKTTAPAPKAEPTVQVVSGSTDNTPKLQTATMSEFVATEAEPAPKSAAAPVKPATPAKAATSASKPVTAKTTPPAATPKASPISAKTPTAATTAKPAASATTASAAPATTASPVATPAPQEFVVLQPSYKPKTQEPQMLASANPPPPLARAGDAASKFSSTPNEVAMSATPAMSAMQTSATPAQGQQAHSAPATPQSAQMQPLGPRPKYTGEPISVNLKDVDLKDFFRLIHEISGLNVILDPNVHGSLTIVLDDVPWDQALDIVLKNNGLERELDGNVLRIATIDTLRREADARRAQIEARSLADPKITVTRFLSYAHSKDVVPIVKKFLSQRGEIISDDRTNGLIIQDIPSVFPEIDRLLTQLDRKTPEVEIEARVVAATRNFARDIGTQFGFAWGNGATAVGGAGSVGNSPITVNTTPPIPYITSAAPATGTSAVPVQIPLFSAFPAVGPTSGLSFVHVASNYRIDTILTLAESKGLLKILSRPRVVTQNNIQAVVRQGVRIPIVTLGQFNGPSTTTYIDAFLRLTVTPQITVENTIFLNVDVENTSPDFGHQVQGNPTLLTQQATTQVLVTDGGTVVIGGVIQTQNSVSVTQVPLLGDIPILGNLFKRRSVSTQTQELIFFITPKIVQT